MRISVLLVMLLLPLPTLASECVILLHGLARTASSMNKMEARFLQENFTVANIDYPSRKHTIDKLATLAIEQGLEICKAQSASAIHFVTHSLGGILVRYYLSKYTIDNLGRTVMLAPPNSGSEIIDNIGRMPGFKLINGPASLQLGTGTQSVPRSLGPANFEAGIIAGTCSINLFLSLLIPGKDDGKVSLASAHLENEKDFLSLSVAHPFIMKNKKVIDNAVHFVKFGKFIDVPK